VDTKEATRVQLEHQFTVPAPPDVVWAAVVDPARVAPCMPGATLTEVNGSEFAGSVKVKLGPVSLLYKGSGQFVEIDEQSKRVVIKASGKDSRGNGTASATVTVTLKPDGANTHGAVVTDLAITGKPAQFGRGMIAEVGGKILDTFAGCLAGKLGVEAPATPAAEEPKPAPRRRTTRTRTAAAAKADETPAEQAKPAAPKAPAKPAAKPAAAGADDAKPAAAAAKSAAAGANGAKPAAAKPAAARAEPKPAAAKAVEPEAKPAARAAAAAKPKPVVNAEVKPAPVRPVAAVPATNVPANNGAPVRADEPTSAPPKLRVVAEPEVEPIDLLDYAGPSVAKRVIPLVAGAVALFLLIRWLRRR
jgi:carbon monoxide dehydrogenase subunit G